MRELTKSMLSFSLGMSLFGVKQLTNILSSSDSSQPTSQAVAAWHAATHTTEEQYSAAVREAFQTGDQLQRDMVDLLFGVLTLEACTPRRITKVTFDMLQQSAEVGRWLMPGRENRLAWQEFRNKLQAFDLFEHVDVVLSIPAGPDLSLTALLVQADALGPYRAVWALEGLGRYYAETCWTHKGTPHHLLMADQVSALPPYSLVPLHTGMGLSLADRLLATVQSQGSDAATGRMLQQFIALCQHNSRVGYTRAVIEALGLVTRLRCPELIPIVDRQLSSIDPDLVGYFWHGVGRGLYFLPLNALPCASSNWRAVEMAQGEAPHALGRLNALAGLAWAVTLVNIRHPEILEAFLHQHAHALSENDACANGVSSALMMWYDMQGDDPYLRAFCRYQPDATVPGLVQLWNSQVRGPCQEALQSYYGVLKAWHSLDEVFRYQPLAVLVDRLKGEPAR
jgi:hypothetical protein